MYAHEHVKKGAELYHKSPTQRFSTRVRVVEEGATKSVVESLDYPNAPHKSVWNKHLFVERPRLS